VIQVLIYIPERNKLMTPKYDNEKIIELLSNADTINDDNHRYFREHEEHLAEEYGGQIIVIIDQEVVTAREFTANLNELRDFLQMLREEFGQETVREAYITHVPDPQQALIL
jgi:hypothetical protein